jgi:predicted transcriptional regulator
MKISKEKRDKISEQILSYMFISNPKPLYTSHIAKELARDEEFIKRILLELKSKKLVTEIKKNSEGIAYLRRSRWKLTESAYSLYKKLQLTKQNQF